LEEERGSGFEVATAGGKFSSSSTRLSTPITLASIDTRVFETVKSGQVKKE
jgi:hypothetical protein